MQINKKTYIAFGIIVGLLVLAGFAMATSNFIKLRDSEWTCIAQECSEFARGDDWVKQNCDLQGKEMICEFQYEGQYLRVPLSGIENLSNMVSCAQYECASQVLISNK